MSRHNPAMQPLRSARLLARFVLACFVMAIGVAVASPLLRPAGMELVCSGAGAMKVLVKNADGSTSEQGGHTLHCPLCAATGAPPPAFPAQVVPPQQQLSYALRPLPAARIAARTAVPPPGRGPPTVS